MIKRAMCMATLALAAIAAWAAPASAHAIVKETTPAIDSTVADPPDRVIIRFNEAVELAFGAIRVYDTTQHRVDHGNARHQGGNDTVAVALDDDLPDGTYTVTWRVVSADGHPIHEAFVFHVGEPGPRPEGIATELLRGQQGAGRLEDALAVVARWVTFAALLMLVGAFAFWLLIWRGRELTTASERVNRSIDRVVVVSLIGAALGTLAAFVLQGAIAGDLSLGDALGIDVLREVGRTRFGVVSFIRLGLLAAIVVIAATTRSRRNNTAAMVAVALAVAAAATPGIAAHAGTSSPVAVNVAADALHVAAAGVWIGGLLVLLGAVIPIGRGHDAADRAAASALVARFSDVALVAIGAIVLTGFVRSGVEVGSVAALGESYGVVLLTKVGAFVPIVAAGFVNSRVLKPRLENEDRSWRLLRGSVALEVVLAVAVLALTAVLVNLVPARVAAAGGEPFITDVRLGEYNLNVLVDPNRIGENEVHMTATTKTGAPAPVEAMTVQFRLPEEDIGPLVADGVELAPGHFVVQGRQLSVSGRWVLEFVGRVGRFDEVRATATVRVEG